MGPAMVGKSKESVFIKKEICEISTLHFIQLMKFYRIVHQENECVKSVGF